MHLLKSYCAIFIILILLKGICINFVGIENKEKWGAGHTVESFWWLSTNRTNICKWWKRLEESLENVGKYGVLRTSTIYENVRKMKKNGSWKLLKHYRDF